MLLFNQLVGLRKPWLIEIILCFACKAPASLIVSQATPSRYLLRTTFHRTVSSWFASHNQFAQQTRKGRSHQVLLLAFVGWVTRTSNTNWFATCGQQSNPFARTTGLEPATFRVTSGYSNQLSYVLKRECDGTAWYAQTLVFALTETDICLGGKLAYLLCLL